MKKWIILFLVFYTVQTYAQHESLFNKWYGVEWSTTNSDPDVTRIAEDDSLNCHMSTVLPVHSLMKACILKDDGTVNYYLHPNNWLFKTDSTTASVLDGTDGQVMIEIPSHWEKFETDGNTRRVKISLVYHSGFNYVPKMYVGAYKAALNRTTLKLASVVNTTTTYRGGNNNATWDGTDRTLVGKPATAITKTNFRTYAQNRGVNWSMYSYTAWKKVLWLYTIEYATRNSQKAVDATLTAGGYHKGGLGNGVTNLVSAEWNTYYSNYKYPVIPCGQSNSIASGTGEVDYNIPGYTGTNAVKINRYRGIEEPFGEIYEWVDGIQIQFLQTQATAKAYITENPNQFADDGGKLGRARTVIDVSKVTGYIKAVAFGLYGDIISSGAGSSGTGSSTYYCDYFYSGYTGSYWGWLALLVGGNADSGSDAGLCCAFSHYAASNSTAYFGSRLVFLGS